MKVNGKPYRTIWMEGTVVKMIDQPRLPHFFEIVDASGYQDTAKAIREMVVRGAGAIGAAGGFGMAQVVFEAPEGHGFADFVDHGAVVLRGTRPTAQNLFYAIDRVKLAIDGAGGVAAARLAAAEAAQAIADEDAAACEMI